MNRVGCRSPIPALLQTRTLVVGYLSPRVLDINELVANMKDVLHRTLGAGIDIEIETEPQLWKTHVDPGQLENVLLILCINARDAMSNAGKLVIRTTNKHLSVEYAAARTEVTAGDYVMLSVVDSGIGMPPEVLERDFEPFFTTKDIGQGSGLGLSMAFGFAKQSKGHTIIESEPDHGSTVSLFLPRACETEKL